MEGSEEGEGNEFRTNGWFLRTREHFWTLLALFWECTKYIIDSGV
ncbi:MAG TPA: hypothetical protein VIW25_12685 [Nitrososphaeraceae archaeon]